MPPKCFRPDSKRGNAIPFPSNKMWVLRSAIASASPPRPRPEPLSLYCTVLLTRTESGLRCPRTVQHHNPPSPYCRRRRGSGGRQAARSPPAGLVTPSTSTAAVKFLTDWDTLYCPLRSVSPRLSDSSASFSQPPSIVGSATSFFRSLSPFSLIPSSLVKGECESDGIAVFSSRAEKEKGQTLYG